MSLSLRQLLRLVSQPLPRSGDAGVEQLLRKHSVVLRGRNHQRVGELRALRLVDGYGQRRLGVRQEREGYEPLLLLAVGEHRVPAFLRPENDADVAVVDPEVPVIAGNHDREPIKEQELVL